MPFLLPEDQYVSTIMCNRRWDKLQHRETSSKCPYLVRTGLFVMGEMVVIISTDILGIW